MVENVPRWRLVLAFAILYIVWGTSYVAIARAIETIPPFLMGGTRFVIAGILLMLWARSRGAPLPTQRNWRAATLTGALLFLVANGAVVWAEQFVSSGVTALLNAVIPLWIVLIDWLRYRSIRPGLPLWIGLGLGFVGIMLLITPNQFAGGEGVHIPGAIVLAIGGISWAFGSLVARQADLPKSPSMATGMQLLCGGIMLLALGAVTGELTDFQLSQVSQEAVIAVIYLICFPSIVAYSSYVWLMRVADAAHVSTYAYVNPVVAVILGALLNNEAITGRTLIAAAVILSGVFIINTYRAQGEARFNWRLWRRNPAVVAGAENKI